jgi:hypothetical protein
MLRDDATLLDILKAARLAVMFKGDLDNAAFCNDLKTQSVGSAAGGTARARYATRPGARRGYPWGAVVVRTLGMSIRSARLALLLVFALLALARSITAEGIVNDGAQDAKIGGQ